MKLTVIQPAYFPNISVLCRMAHADVAIWADSFQYSKHSTINRTRIKTVSGASWLTVPVLTAGRKSQSISRVEIDKAHFWRQAHLRSLEVSYQNSPYYNFFAEEIKNILDENPVLLKELLFASAQFLLKKMRLQVKVVKSRDLPDIKDRSQRVAAWMRECNCGEYIVEEADMAHIDAGAIAQAGFGLCEFEFRLMEYHQLFSSYIENLSGLDLLFNEGELSKHILSTSANLKRMPNEYV